MREYARRWDMRVSGIRMARAAVLGFAVLAQTALLAAVRTIDLPVSIQSTSGFKQENGCYVPMETVVDLNGNQPVVVEAERADETLNVKTIREQDGREYVTRFHRLRYYVASDAKRTIAVWGRVRHGATGASLYVQGKQWTAENEAKSLKLDPAKAYKDWAGKWRWAKLLTITLSPGESALQLIAASGTPEIDQLALITGDASPEDVALLPARQPVQEYTIVSDDITLPAAQRLVSAIAEGRIDGGELEASVNGGKTWSPARDLRLNTQCRLRLRFPAEKAPRASVTGFSARLEVDSAQYFVLENPHVRIGIDTVTPGIFRLESPALQTVFCAPPAAKPLFSLKLKQVGKPWPDPEFVLEPKDGKLLSARLVDTPQGPSARLSYALLDGKLTATVSIVLGIGQESVWNLELDNRSDWDVLTYTFPRLASLRVGQSGYDDRWLSNNLYGPWMGNYAPEHRPYPGAGSMGYSDLFDEQAGLSIATRDPKDGITHFTLQPTQARWGETVSWEITKEHCVPAGTTRTWTYAMLVHTGDWHAAADVYGDWFRANFGVADHWPEWAKDSNGWISIAANLQDSTFKWPQLLDVYETGRRMGINHVQVWGQFGGSTCSSFWWPSPKYGPLEEFIAVNKQIRDMGGHIGYYLMYDRENRYNIIDTKTYSGYLPQTAYPKGVPILTPEQFTKGSMVSDPTGKITAWPQSDEEMRQFKENLARLHAEHQVTTWAGSATWPKGSMAEMNPLDTTWQDWLAMWTVGYYVKQWHCDSAYQDVLGASNNGRSFDLRRGEHGQVLNGEGVVAERLVKEGLAADPNFLLSAEGKSELVTRWAAGMTSSGRNPWIQAAPHRYTHPDHILYIGEQNGGYHQAGDNAELAYLFGARFELIGSRERTRVQQIVTFRETFKRFSLRARYRDTVGLRVTGEEIKATRHERFADGSQAILVTVVNEGGVQDGTLAVDISQLPAQYGAFWLTDDWQAVHAQITPDEGHGWISTRIPATRISALLLAAKALPGEELLGGIRTNIAPGGARTNVWVANLTPERRTVTLTLDGPTLRGKTIPLTLDPYGVFSQTVDGTFQRGEEKEGDIILRVDKRMLHRNYLYPLAEDGSFEESGALVPDAPHGKRVLQLLPKEDSRQWGTSLLNLQPGRTYRITVQGWRSGEKGTMFGYIRLRSAAQGWKHHRLDFPKGVFNHWVELTGDITCTDDLTQADIYLYNDKSKETVLYDHVQVEMLK